jgi:magnesium transporter
LLDSIIDSYFPFIDHLADQLDKIDESITDTKGIAELEELHYFRRQLLSLRRVVRPHRDMINQLIRDEFDCISPETRIFLRDCFDHVIHVNDAAETYNELANGIRDYQMSIISNRMNEIMKVLTIMSSIFIPLSFVAGVYGMNFNTALPGNMPELNVPYGYVGALALMACMAGGMLSFFRYKRWI